MSFVSWNTSVNWLSSPLQYIVPLHYLTMCNAVYIIVVRSIISYNYTSQVLYIWPQLCSYSKTVFISAIYTNIWASYSGFTRFCWSGYGSVTIKSLDSWYFFVNKTPQEMWQGVQSTRSISLLRAVDSEGHEDGSLNRNGEKRYGEMIL